MFSLVVPTLNEEEFLPRLLDGVRNQFLKPTEIIIADANSKDRTREIARKYGCKIVQGGRIALGRNNGVKASKEKIVVMMDADSTIPNKNFFNKIIGTFISKNADVASCFFLPSDKRVKYEIPMAGINAVKYITHKVKWNLIIGGACIITTKEAFNKLNGFDANKRTREDNDYFNRAVKMGMKFIIIREVLRTSTRRYEKTGLRKTIILGILGILAGIIGGGLLRKKHKKMEKKFWDNAI